MITIIYGPARSGKTSLVFDRIKNDGIRGQKSILIVPEQYSHNAERHLCKECGNGVSMYSEVISFSRLVSKLIGQNVSAGKPLDGGGRMLVMMRALNMALPQLRAFRSIHKKADFVKDLVETYSEMRAFGIAPETVAAASDKTAGMLSDKLRDMSLIFAAYEGDMPSGMYDPADGLDMLRDKAGESDIGIREKIYIDGFTDFTAQEKAVLQELIKKGSDITVCLTTDSLDSDTAAFKLPNETARFFMREAREYRQEIEIINADPKDGGMSNPISFFGDNLFSYGAVRFPGECDCIEICKADDMMTECEIAASAIIKLVRDHGYRWRDFAVAVRDWDAWQDSAENVFAAYNVPLQMTVKTDIIEKPVIAAVFGALDVILGDWDYKSVFKYLKTGMTGIAPYDIDLLENYVIKWNIHGSAFWRREEPWSGNPDGYTKNVTEEQEKTLRRVNEMRRDVIKELGKFEDDLKLCKTGGEKAACLYGFLEAIELPARIEDRAKALKERGNMQLCDEYLQLWDILVNGLEQYAAVIGGETVDNEEFYDLLRLVISQYDVATIPVSLDRVSIGDMTRMKRRDIKCLILMGMTEDAVPRVTSRSHILSDDERAALSELGVTLGELVDDRITREMNMIYTSVTLPSGRLIMTWNTSEGRGKPSFAVTAAEKMFGITAYEPDRSIKINAPLPCFELALTSGDEDVLKKTAERYFAASEQWKTQFETAKSAAGMARGTLSPDRARSLYGKKLELTATRVDKYYSCRFSYFMQYGLRAKQRKPAGFDAPEAGTFMHYLLENVAGDAEKMGGFGSLPRDDCRRLTRKYVEKYVDLTLGGFKDKNSRFKYLFNRLAADAENVVLDMADELRDSDFSPVDFELRFARGGDVQPANVADGDTEVTVTGIVDRADGWVHDGKLYLRVIDYKTGKKAFSLSDIYYGLGMQMLIYLFVLQKYGDSRYGREIVPAGVLYAPARDVIIQLPKNSSDEEIEKTRSSMLRRNGLILSDPEVIEAMEHGKAPKFLPVKFKKDGSVSSDHVAGLEQLGKLARHIDRMLFNMGRQLRGGAIDADPFYQGPQDTPCRWCEFFEACHFNEASGDGVRYLRKLKAPEVWDKISEEEK